MCKSVLLAHECLFATTLHMCSFVLPNAHNPRSEQSQQCLVHASSTFRRISPQNTKWDMGKGTNNRGWNMKLPLLGCKHVNKKIIYNVLEFIFDCFTGIFVWRMKKKNGGRYIRYVYKMVKNFIGEGVCSAVLALALSCRDSVEDRLAKSGQHLWVLL